jgi:choline dehydrogenase-like flavoprotein
MIANAFKQFLRAPADGPWRAEVVVVGSGPGGSVTACALAEAGRDVLLVEEGPYQPPDACAPFSAEEMTRKYRNGGLTVTLGPGKVSYVEGRCVGGGSEVNSGIYHRVPAPILEMWRREFVVDALSESDLLPHYEACEADLSVSLAPAGRSSLASRKLRDGAAALGWRAVESPRCFRYGRPGAGGPPVATKQSMTRTYVPRALRAGCRLLCEARIDRFERRGPAWQLVGRRPAPAGLTRPVTIEADAVFLACGAVQTPALLRRSGIRTNVGNTLQLHPTAKVVAWFSEDVTDEAMLVPVHQVKEFAPRLTFGCSISTPAHLALALLEHPAQLPLLQSRPARAAVYYAMLSGAGRGTVRPLPFFRDPLVRYQLSPLDRKELAGGIRELCRLLLRAGATLLAPGVPGAPAVRGDADLDRLPDTIRAGAPLMSIHLFSSCPMGEGRRCAADSFGRVHGHGNLYLADASLLCTSPSVNPQGAIMAIARRNARHFLKLN